VRKREKLDLRVKARLFFLTLFSKPLGERQYQMENSFVRIFGRGKIIVSWASSAYSLGSRAQFIHDTILYIRALAETTHNNLQHRKQKKKKKL